MGEWAYCPECGVRKPIEDRFVEDTGDSRVHVEVFTVTVLACGHTTETKVGEYRSPLQQAGPTPAMHAPDPFLREGE